MSLDPYTTHESAIALGIKAVGVGRRGSKPLEPQLIQEISYEFAHNRVPPIAQGAFLGALILKGITDEEHNISKIFPEGVLNNPRALVKTIAGDAPDYIQNFCVQLLNGKTLSRVDAEHLGDFLFSDESGDGARGMAASILRVRYETPDEYEGLLISLNKTIESAFRSPLPQGDPIIQLAEPFDGVDHSNLITPLMATFIQTLSYRVVSLTGRNGGPKFGNNLRDIAESINGTFLKKTRELEGSKPSCGWYLNQPDLSRPLDQWIEFRHQIIKRPFISTLERFLNPFDARIMIASAFHPPYGEKMLTICERAGYPGAIIIRNGLEGTMAFPLMRSAKVLCSARQNDGTYMRNEFTIDPNRYLDRPVKREERLTDPSLSINTALIEEYLRHGKTSYALFDARVKVTCAGLKQALEWIEQNLA